MNDSISDADLTLVLGGMVMALSATMPPELARHYAHELRTCALAQAHAGNTIAHTLLRAIAQAADAAARIPRPARRTDLAPLDAPR